MNYPDRRKLPQLVYAEYTVLILDANFLGRTHALKLNDLSIEEIRRIIGFFWSEQFGAKIKADPLLKNTLKRFDKFKKNYVRHKPNWNKPRRKGFNENLQEGRFFLKEDVYYRNRPKITNLKQFYTGFVKPLIQTFPFSIYRQFLRGKMRNIRTIKVTDLLV